MRKYIISAAIALFCITQTQITATQQPAASELLDKYAENLNKRESCIVKTESSVTGSKYPDWVKYSTGELRYDGERASSRYHMWGDVSPRIRVKRDLALYQSRLWDGEDFYQYDYSKHLPKSSIPFGLTIISKGKKISNKEYNRRIMTVRNFSCGPLMGFFEYDAERIDKILRRADQISTRDKMENVGGSDCYVIDAVTKRGKYTLWIDPEHGYNIAKAVNTKESGDLTFSYDYLLKNEAKISYVIENIRFDKVDGVWIPVEADMKNSRTTFEGKFFGSSQFHVKIAEVVLNPDHDALDSFVPDDIKNGAKVLLKGVIGISYTWQDGELIPDVDKSAVDQLDKMADKIMVQESPNQPSENTKSSQLPDDLTVSKLLDRYRAAQDKLQSFIAEGQTKVANPKASQAKSWSEEELCEFRYDGDRVAHRSCWWDGVFTTRESPAYKSFLWDGQWLMQYRKDSDFGEGQVFISKNDNRKEQLISKEYNGAALMGYCAGDYHRVDSIFAKAEAASLRDKTEQVGESQCYVIDTDTKRGKYTIWIDPDHGYNLAKVEVQRTKGDLFGDRETVKSEMSFSLINVRFEKVDDVWVPMEADMQLAKDNQINVWHHKRTKMRLNPDHDALGSFAADDIPNGTKVIIPVLHAEYKWQNGKVVTKDGGDVKF